MYKLTIIIILLHGFQDIFLHCTIIKGVLFAFGYKYAPCDLNSNILNVTYTLYNEKYVENGVKFNYLNVNKINTKYRTIIIIHGWLQNAKVAWIKQMKNAYLSKGEANIIVVDWSPYARLNYFDSFCNVPQVGTVIGNFIYHVANDVHLKLSNIQIVGFSLGGHVAGFVGKQIKLQSGGTKIGRIDGLDIAGPLYLNLPAHQRLDKNDAIFVQGIHTSNNQFGYSDTYADVDFHINCISSAQSAVCGKVQPGCPKNPGVEIIGMVNRLKLRFFCDHVRSVMYFIESIQMDNFHGVLCNCDKYGNRKCNSSVTNTMGNNCLPNPKGEFFLSTNHAAPYGKNEINDQDISYFEKVPC